MSFLREIFSLRFLTSVNGIVFWFGKLCLFMAVGFAYFAGRSFQDVDRDLAGDLSLVTQAEAMPVKAKLPFESYSVVLSSPIFGKPKAKPTTGPAAPPPSPLKLRLVGVDESANGSRMAIIEDTQKQQQDVFTTGAKVFDQAKLVEIQRDRVQLERNGKLETLSLDSAPSEAGPAQVASADTETTQTDFTVPEDEVTEALSNLPLLLSQARAVPYFRNGQSIGMRLFAIRSGSLYEKLGMKNGDIVLAVNENSLSDPTQALKLFEQLKTERSIGVKVERNGANVDLHYSIR